MIRDTRSGIPVAVETAMSRERNPAPHPFHSDKRDARRQSSHSPSRCHGPRRNNDFRVSDRTSAPALRFHQPRFFGFISAIPELLTQLEPVPRFNSQSQLSAFVATHTSPPINSEIKKIFYVVSFTAALQSFPAFATVSPNWRSSSMMH